MPLAAARRAALLAIGVAGCAAPSGADLQTYWGPIDDGGTSFERGGAEPVVGVASHSFGRDYDRIDVALLSGERVAGCTGYANFLRATQDAQEWLVARIAADGSAPRGPTDDESAIVCQHLDAAAREAFGGDGHFRARHFLLDRTGQSPVDGVFVPAPEEADGGFTGAGVLRAGTYVARWHERDLHGDGVLPAGVVVGWRSEDLDPVYDCAAILGALAGDWMDGRTDYPDRASIALQAAAHRWYHVDPAVTAVGTSVGGSATVAVSLDDREWTGDTNGSLTVTAFAAVSRAPSAFPYSEQLVTLDGETIDVEACPALAAHEALLWPEVPWD